MNVAEAAIRYKTVTLVATVMLIGGGLLAYQRLGRLEDPEFTIKSAQIFTLYPGASAMEVAEEVTDELETAVQQMGQVDIVTSISEPGKSTILVEIKPTYAKDRLPQIWDELRRKVGDAQRSLPPGCSTSVVYDDFGDVFGVFFAVYGDGYSYAELKKHVDLLRRELLLCDDVAKVTSYGERQEVIYVEISRARLAQLGVSPDLIHQTLTGQNLVAPAGEVEVDGKYIRIRPSGEFTSVEDISELLILQNADGAKIRVRDVARVYRDYADPPTTIMRYNGKPAIGVGVSTVEGGNVVTMGQSVERRLRELQTQTPIGVELGVVAMQADAVSAAIHSFVVSLAQAVAIVIGVLMIAMGLRSGVLIGVILLLTVFATFIVMRVTGVMLERISLGALIIALGMLVDNAIVVVEGILINLQRGMQRVQAAAAIVRQTMWPLFGATVVAVLAFAAIGASQDSTGEYCRSLFQVILYSLMASWLLAVTVTPLLGVMFLKVKESSPDEDPYKGLFFSLYRKLLETALRFRTTTVVVMIVLLVVSVVGFGGVRRSFFPPSTRPQFMLHYWLPQGAHISRTERDLTEISGQIATDDDVVDVAAFVGKGALRFLLTYQPEDANSAYGMLLITVKDYRKIDELMQRVQDDVSARHPDARAFARKFMLGPGDPSKIQVRLRGPDPDALRRLAQEIKTVIADDPQTTDIYDDWRERVPLVRPVVAETAARNLGVTRAQIAEALQVAFSGEQVGLYRDGDLLLPIIARSPASEHQNVDNIRDVQIWSPVANGAVPIRQVATAFESSSENTIVRRRDRLPTITVKCDPLVGEASEVFEQLRGPVEARFAELTRQWSLTGYELEWGGEYENSTEAQQGLVGKMPVVALLMVLTVICLFNSIRQPLIIFLTVPLAVIGVAAGLLLTDQPFGFMALLGFMSLAGMLIKNAIVLVDEINVQLAAGKAPYNAIVDSGVSRARPVAMAALTTVLGMIPLLQDAFFVAMAVTIMFGLTFATVLTLVVVPVLYAIFYRVQPRTN